ncbi:MAG: sensor histidine kinase [Bacteroidales bacterium]|nr:sensor histidine kinase [Bacteroidales bacterium]
MNFNPKNVAFLNAVIIALAFAAVLTAIDGIFYKIMLWPLILGSLTMFVVSYLIIHFSLQKFIYQRLKIIYKTIGKVGSFDTKKQKSSKTEDVLDIVNQMVLEWRDEQQKKIDELQKNAEYRREFLGNVSHELKTPIFNIQGYVLTLLDQGLKDETINMKFLQKTEKSVNRMIAIVEDLEEIAKFESGELKLNEEVFDLHELCRDIADFLEIKAEQNNSKIIIKETPGKTVKVKADKKRIRQVLINLVDNAIKYGNQINGVIEISFYDFHDNYLVEVSDNGIGIPESSIPRVFERFFRTDKSRSRDKGGTGLGLAIVKHIIEAHRQSISVRSQVSKGTTFSFTLKKAK